MFHDRKVMVLSPHSDDAEYSVSGTIAMFPDSEWTIHVMSPGSRGDAGSKPSRFDEMRSFWDVMKANVRLEVYDDCFVGDKTEEEWINEIRDRASDYDVLLIPSGDDTHYEHRLAYNVGRALVRHTPTSVISYSTPSTAIGWTPNLFVDISSMWSRKLVALFRLTSQLERDYFSEESILSFHSFPQACKRGHTVAERLRVEEGYL